jgi:toxin-antitoxin system PIN domain toxin
VTGHLLDTNLLIALLWPSHEQHDLAVRWFASHRAHGWCTCPFTQAGFIRIVSNPAFSRDAVLPREAGQVLSANTAAADHTFWPDDAPFADVAAFAGLRLVGHQQVTDAYLLGLAARRGGALVTLDSRIAALAAPGSAERQALVIVT